MFDNPTRLPRRAFLRTSAAAATIGVSSTLASAESGAQVTSRFASVKALVFDVFGTVVDWRTSVSRQAGQLARSKNLTIDAPKFADAWRAQYQPNMNRVRSGELPWTKLDDLHRMALDTVLADFGVTQLSEAEKADLNRAWHRLDPWPDTVAGLTRLKKRFVIAPLSNGNIALITNMAKHAGLPWDCVLGAELVRHYKPDPEVYRSAAELLNLQPGEVMMVAAHSNDLRAAKAVGLHTAFVVRAREYGPDGKPELQAGVPVDLSAKNFLDLADLVGA